MSLRVQRSEWFIADLEHYAARYDSVAGWELAERYLRAVAVTLEKLAEIPTLGHVTYFNAPELRGLRCKQVERPFQKNLLFYRLDKATIYAERAVHGSRDLPLRLAQSPGN
jgi:plasmid stabilization system protein ParE